MDMLTAEENDFQEATRLRVEEILLMKFRKTNVFSEAEKQGVQMTIMAQIKVHTKVIFEEARYRVANDRTLQAEMEKMTDAQIGELFMAEVEKEAERIAMDEFEFERNIDVERFMKREKEVKDRIEKGELTTEEAYEILREPIVVEKENEEADSQKYEENYRAYSQAEKEKEKGKTSRKGDKCKDYRKSQFVPPQDRRNPKKREENTGNSRHAEAEKSPEEDLIH